VAVRGGLLGGVGEVWRVQILKFKPNQRAVGSLAVRPPPPPQLLVASCSTIARVDFKMLPSVVMLCSVQLVLLFRKLDMTLKSLKHIYTTYMIGFYTLS
jgi:hypothetical protein